MTLLPSLLLTALLLIVLGAGLWLAVGQKTKQIVMQFSNDEELRDRAQRKRKAVIVAINRWADGDTLAGCDRDGINMAKFLCDYWNVPMPSDFESRYWSNEAGFYGRISTSDTDIRVVRNNRATAAEMKRLFAWLVEGTKEGDGRLFYPSMHGTQVKSGTEPDGLDESFVPYDFDWNKPETWFTDDIVADAKRRLPKGANLTIVADTCHSGDFLRSFGEDMPKARFKTPPAEITSGRSVKRHFAELRSVDDDDSVLLLSGCTADTVSYTTTATDANGQKVQEGALTRSLLKNLRQTPLAPSALIHARIRAELQVSKYKQDPQLEGSERLKTLPFLGV